MAEGNATPVSDEQQAERAKKAEYMRKYRKRNRERYKEIDKAANAKKRAKDPEAFKAKAREQMRRLRQKKRDEGGISDEELEAKREANRERGRRHREKHGPTPEYRAKKAATARKLYAANPQKYLDVVHRRRAKLEEGSVTTEEWNGILVRYKHRCAYCRRSDVKLNQDHVQPLTRGGKHEPGNVVPCCRPCNTRKNNRPWPFPEPPTEED